MAKLPKGFGSTMRRLIAQGYKPKDAMREAWRIHKSGVKKSRAAGLRSRGLRAEKNPIAIYNPRKRYRRATTERQRRFMGAELGRRRAGKKTITEMSTKQLQEFARKNPRPKWQMLYGDVIEVRAIKTTGEYKGQPFRHTFKTRVLALGLPNGTVLLEAANGSRLWDFEENI